MSHGAKRRRKQKKPTKKGPWLTAEQVRDYLGLGSVKAVYEATRAGKLVSYRWGHRVLYRQEEIDEIVSQGRKEPARYVRKKRVVLTVVPDVDGANWMVVIETRLPDGTKERDQVVGFENFEAASTHACELVREKPSTYGSSWLN
jgi:hypothetical protein